MKKPLHAGLFVSVLLAAFAFGAHSAKADEPDVQPSAEGPKPMPTEQPVYPYVAPLYQRTQPSYVPQSVALSGPQQLAHWKEGEPVPAGYHVVERTRRGLIIGGAVTFGSLYLLSTSVAASLEGYDDVSVLYIPCLGPFLLLSKTENGMGQWALAVDGLAQIGGVAMLVVGLTQPAKVLVRNDLAKNSITVTPTVTRDSGGVQLVGTF